MNFLFCISDSFTPKKMSSFCSSTILLTFVIWLASLSTIANFRPNPVISWIKSIFAFSIIRKFLVLSAVTLWVNRQYSCCRLSEAFLAIRDCSSSYLNSVVSWVKFSYNFPIRRDTVWFTCVIYFALSWQKSCNSSIFFNYLSTSSSFVLISLVCRYWSSWEVFTVRS